MQQLTQSGRATYPPVRGAALKITSGIAQPYSSAMICAMNELTVMSRSACRMRRLSCLRYRLWLSCRHDDLSVIELVSIVDERGRSAALCLDGCCQQRKIMAMQDIVSSRRDLLQNVPLKARLRVIKPAIRRPIRRRRVRTRRVPNAARGRSNPRANLPSRT